MPFARSPRVLRGAAPACAACSSSARSRASRASRSARSRSALRLAIRLGQSERARRARHRQAPGRIGEQVAQQRLQVGGQLRVLPEQQRGTVVDHGDGVHRGLQHVQARGAPAAPPAMGNALADAPGTYVFQR